MGRRPDGTHARTLTVHIRITPAGLAHLDAAAGERTRSDYIRDLIAQDITRRCVHLQEKP